MSERHQAAARKRGAERTEKVSQQIDAALLAIENELQANAGIYPKNGGAVSMAEIARCAAINESTLYKKANAALKDRVEIWLAKLKKKEIVGRMRVRKTHQERAESLTAKYGALENRHIRTELELQALQAEHEKLQIDHRTLRRDYDALLEQIQGAGRNKIIAFPRGKK